MSFYSTKTYGNERGLSCCFRQHSAVHSHCSKLHGYSLGVRLTFACDHLDSRGWVMDFGGLKELWQWLQDTFDHKTVVAEDDPLLPEFRRLAAVNAIDLRVLPAVGCERFSHLVFSKMTELLQTSNQLNPSVRVHSVEVFEHGANSAIFEAP